MAQKKSQASVAVDEDGLDDDLSGGEFDIDELPMELEELKDDCDKPQPAP